MPGRTPGGRVARAPAAGVLALALARAGAASADGGVFAKPLLPRQEVLPLSDINIAITTDIHSWVQGREHEPNYNATLGHMASLFEQLLRRAHDQGKDVFFFDNGDINDGTGMSGTSQDHVEHVAPLMQMMPYDALNIGNHELYELTSGGLVPGKECVVTSLRDSGYISSWKGKYLTSNVVWKSTGEPVGSRYTVATGRFGTQLLVFGFLYNMDDHCAPVVVEDVATVVKASWFVEALRQHADQSDAIVVLAHMHYTDELVYVILRSIRDAVGDKFPVQFVTGHSHRRLWERLDNFATSFEAGCKLNTFGFTSFASKGAQRADGEPLEVFHDFVSGNSAALAAAGAVAEASLLESHGAAVVKAIKVTQDKLQLGETLGCSDRHYSWRKNLTDPDSLWALYAHRVLPRTLFEAEVPNQWALVGTGALIYDIFPGVVTLNDVYTTSPFGNYWFRLRNMSGSVLEAMYTHLNLQRGHKVGIAGAKDAEEVPAFMPTGPLDASKVYDLIYCDFDALEVEGYLSATAGLVLHPALFREGSNTSSVLADWVRLQSCTEQRYV